MFKIFVREDGTDKIISVPVKNSNGRIVALKETKINSKGKKIYQVCKMLDIWYGPDAREIFKSDK